MNVSSCPLSCPTASLLSLGFPLLNFLEGAALFPVSHRFSPLMGLPVPTLNFFLSGVREDLPEVLLFEDLSFGEAQGSGFPDSVLSAPQEMTLHSMHADTQVNGLVKTVAGIPRSNE